MIMIVLVALYAGVVAFVASIRPRGLERAAVVGGVTVAAVTGSFTAMILLAQVSLPATWVLAALFTGAVAHLVLLPDLGRARAALTAAGAALLIGAAFAFVSYLAVLAFVGAAGVYLLLRLGLRTRPALLVMGGTLGGLLAASGLVFAIALAGM